jgi:hypothetical protein
MTSSRLALGAAIAIAAHIAWGGTALAEQRPAVVELFTSQGCSDCPPADAFLGDLAQRKDVIALAYHIDYWDRLGWKDVFSSHEATLRQYAYSRAMNLDGVYTPEMVIDGQIDAIGSRRDEVMAKLKATPHDGVPITLTREGHDIVIRIGMNSAAQVTKTAASDAKAGDVVVVAYSDAAETQVPRGENAGQTLREFNIVRGFWSVGAWNGSAQELRFDAGKLPQGATRLAVLVQAPGPGAILGATAQTIP